MIPRNVVWNPRVSISPGQRHGMKCVVVTVKMVAYTAMLGLAGKPPQEMTTDSPPLAREPDYDVECETFIEDFGMGELVRQNMIEDALEEAWREAHALSMRRWCSGLIIPPYKD